MAFGPYDLYPVPRRRRAQGNPSWLINGRIALDHPMKSQGEYETALDFWISCIYGYLAGGALTLSPTLRIAIIRSPL